MSHIQDLICHQSHDYYGNDTSLESWLYLTRHLTDHMHCLIQWTLLELILMQSAAISATSEKSSDMQHNLLKITSFIL